MSPENTPGEKKGQRKKLDSTVEFSLETELRETLQSKIIGQEKCTNEMASIIASRMYSIAPRVGPIAVLFCSGPTGVGKTETCHALSEYFFGNSNSFVKINGEDYQDGHASRNLFGAVKTYIGYGEPTPLNDTAVYKGYTEALEEGTLNKNIARDKKFKNFSIVLIDEVEKMHPDIHQNFLGIFDKGEFRFPTGKEHRDDVNYGQVTDFSNTIFILTSNIGERENAKSGIGFGATISGRQKEGNENVSKAIRDAFSPEFRNRITGFLTYEPLKRENVEKICTLYVDKVAKCLEEYSIKLITDSRVIPWIVDIFETEQKTMEWARGLQKVVQNRFDGVLARIIHSGQLNEFINGQIQIDASYEENQLQFSAQTLEVSPNQVLSPTFGEKLHVLKESRYYLHMERDALIHTYKRISKSELCGRSINYKPFLDVLEKKLIEYGFTKDDIVDLDTEIWEKVQREMGHKITKKTTKDLSEEDIFYPLSLEEVRELILQLWKSQVDFTGKSFKKHHTELRLVIIQKAIRDTMLAFFGQTLKKDQSIWIGWEIHQLYLKSKASLR